jgi:hypothetical protein
MYRERGCYSIHLIFRGLFLAWPGKDKLSVFLPKAVDPKPSELSSERRIREHTGALEFPVRNWIDRACGTRLLELDKPNKEVVALAFLEGEEIAVSSEKETLRTPSPPDSVRQCCNQKVVTGDGSSLLVLDDDQEHEIQALSRFDSGLTDNPKKDLVGWMELKKGFVRSERRSMAQASSVEWWEVTWKDAEAYLAGNLSFTDLQAQYKGRERYLNLDLRVTLAADLDDPLIVELRKKGTAVRSFTLAPSHPGTDVSLWIKNRELRAILEDSDDLAEKPPTDLLTKEDVDHEVFKGLSAQGRHGITIPIATLGGDSDGGCGCGGKCGG